MKKGILFLLVICLALPYFAKADEGMWLPMFIKRLNYKDMQEKGLQLTPEEIYSVNNSSLKDAIVRLGRGFCTGEVISDQGLILTNHHCGFGSIQSLSSVEHDYLTDGFWAMTKSEELYADFSMSFLVRMEDVSEKISAELNDDMSEMERNMKIKEISAQIEKEATEGNNYEAQIKSFYKGNEFYMFIYETFPDVRLVGAPPSSIGKFGGDTDNWMWPRHTGDFSMFRIYADKDGKPAPYSKDNVPYKPKHHLPVSLNGVKQGDYAMIFGYPGSTDRYLTSWGVKLAVEKDQPARVKVRRKKLDIMEEDMAKDPKVKLQYASKRASVSNYWKYFIGQSKGLSRLHIYEKKKAQEDAFAAWAGENENRKQRYGEVIGLYSDAYTKLDKIQLTQTYINEAIFGVEIFAHSFGYSRLGAMLEGNGLDDKVKAQLLERAASHFKNYNAATDKRILAAMIQFYDEDIEKDLQPQHFKDVIAKGKGDYNKIAEKIFAKSIFTSEEKVKAFLNAPNAKKLEKDPALLIVSSFVNEFRGELGKQIAAIETKLERAKRLYVKGLREMHPEKAYAPDANSTMRFTYGNVLDYIPHDAMHYDFYTTLAGIIEKEDPNNDEFIVPDKLKALYSKKDYGNYADKDGNLHVAFITNNDITGGNSGSPVINGKGQLIGTAFDGNWEAMSGDIAFEPQLQRTISVDIRYTLFVIDKFAGAGHLVEEMTLIKDEEETPASTGLVAPTDGQLKTN